METRARKSYKVVRICEAMPTHSQWHYSGRVCLPHEFFAFLVQSGGIEQPLMVFEISKDNHHHLKCGVAEFSAKRGQIWMPDWMMERLNIVKDDKVTVSLLKSRDLPKGITLTRKPDMYLPKYLKKRLLSATFVLFRDESGGRLLRLGAKVILEKHLRYFTVLSEGEVIQIDFNGHVYKLKIEKTLPGPDVIIGNDADISVDFLPEEETESLPAKARTRGEPDFNWQPGDCPTIQFLRK